jgi:hypothetical protein
MAVAAETVQNVRKERRADLLRSLHDIGAPLLAQQQQFALDDVSKVGIACLILVHSAGELTHTLTPLETNHVLHLLVLWAEKSYVDLNVNVTTVCGLYYF